MNEENDVAPTRPGPEPGSYRIGNVDEPVLQAEARRQMLAQSLYAIFSRGVMTRGDESHPRLARQIHLLLGNFPAEVGIGTQFDGFLEKSLRRTCAPGNSPDFPRGIADHQRFAAQPMFDVQGEGIQAHRRFQAAVHPDFLIGETPGFDQAQPLAELGVVAEFRTGVQRQVIGEQAELMRDEQPDARAARAGEAGVVAFPEVAMVHQDGVSPIGERGLDHIKARRHPAYDAAYLASPYHLQPIWAIITKSGDFQQAVQVTVQFLALHCGTHRMSQRELYPHTRRRIICPRLRTRCKMNFATGRSRGPYKGRYPRILNRTIRTRTRCTDSG